jgi:UDP:flavonoid glycosyltransferase YjiC (YdhE family)
MQAALSALGFEVEPRPLPFATIAARSRLLVSHGGHGFVSAGLLAGLPQVVFHYDLEKLLNGLAVARLGLGGHTALATLKPERFGPDLAALHGDDALAARARAAGERFRARAMPHADAAVVEAVGALA